MDAGCGHWCSHSRWDCCGAGTAHAQTGVKVLVLKGSTNATDTAGYNAIKALGDANDFTVEEAAGVTDINTAKLEGYQALVFLNVGGDVLDSAGEAALQGFVEDGKGFLGIGSTATVEPGSSFVNGLIGARPTTTRRRRRRRCVVPGDRVHPSTRDLPLLWNRTDLWYTWGTRPTGTVHTVARYHAPNAAAGDGTTVGGTDHPISWCRDYRGGRSFYTGMGRTEAAYAEDELPQAPARRARVDRRPRARRLQGDDQRQLPRHQGRQRRPDGHRPRHLRRVARPLDRQERLGLLHRPRRLPHRRRARRPARPALDRPHPRPRQRQRRHRLRQRAHLRPGAVHGRGEQRRHARRHAGGLWRRRPGRRAHQRGQPQDGVRPAGRRRRPGLLRDRPTSTCSTSRPSTSRRCRPACRSSGGSRRCRSRGSRASRSNLQTKQLDLRSEQIIFKYDAQIFSCCHVGGGMGFDSEGNLYVTTGDTNSSQGTNGYSGNNPVAKCPTGPNDVAVERPLRRRRTTPTRTRAARRATPTTTTARCCASGRWRTSRRGRRQASGAPTRFRTRNRRTARTCSTATRAAAARPSRRSSRWACATRAACRSTRRRHGVHRVGRPGRRQPERHAGPVDVRERGPDLARGQLWLAVLHGLQAGLP